MSQSQSVLHIDLISLAPAADTQGVDSLIGTASELLAIDNVLTGGVIRAEEGSDFDLGIFFLLAGFADLEPFGTDPRYTRFLQGSVAPLLRSFTGASVSLQSAFPEQRNFAACLALMAPDETYDWEVRSALESWPGENETESVAGLAIGERQQYRGCAMGFANLAIAPRRLTNARFVTSVISGPSLRFT